LHESKKIGQPYSQKRGAGFLPVAPPAPHTALFSTQSVQPQQSGFEAIVQTTG